MWWFVSRATIWSAARLSAAKRRVDGEAEWTAGGLRLGFCAWPAPGNTGDKFQTNEPRRQSTQPRAPASSRTRGACIAASNSAGRRIGAADPHGCRAPAHPLVVSPPRIPNPANKMRTSALLFSALLALLARPARAGPFGLVRPAPGEVLRMYSNMTVQADPAFSVAFDEDFPAFEVRLGGFALGNVTLSQLREGAVYALEPSVPVGMNELTVNATRACQNGTNCPSFRTYILPLTVRASRPITITPGDATGWQLAVASPASNGTTPSFRVGDAVPIRARTNLPDALPWNAVQTAPPGWPANLTAVQVYVGAVYAGSWAPSELAAGVNWTIPNGAFPQGGGFFTVALTGPKICNIVVTPKCAGARAVSGLSGAISVDGSYVSLVASATSTFASAASTTTFARTRTTGSAFTTITGAMFFTPAPPSANTPAAPASDPTADLPIPIGAIVGIVIGGIALIALLVFFGFWLRQHRLNQIEVETAKFLATAPKPGQFGGVTAFHRNSWREPDMDVLARTPGQRSAINLPNYGNVSISASKSAREF